MPRPKRGRGLAQRSLNSSAVAHLRAEENNNARERRMNDNRARIATAREQEIEQARERRLSQNRIRIQQIR